MTSPLVPGKKSPPDREDILNAISRALLLVRSNGTKRKELSEKIEASDDVIASSINEESLLNFVSIGLLGYHFPAEFALIEALWTCRVPPPVTTADRLERIERETAAIKKALA